MTQIYLISPPKIELESFARNLELALQTKKIPVFQLRLKSYQENEILKIGIKLKEICHKYQTLFILNDNFDLALKIGADGVHLGVKDGDILSTRKKSPEGFIIGASCYDSKHLALKAVEEGANYVSFGTFFPSITKNSRGKPNPEILNWCNEILPLQSVAIGGINANNYHELVKKEVDFIAVISYVWNHPKGVISAIESLKIK